MVVLALPPLIERLAGPERRVRAPEFRQLAEEAAPHTPGELLVRFARSIGHMMFATVPLVAVGVLVSSFIVPVSFSLAVGGSIAAVALIGGIAVLVALPTFFEIPLAFLLLQFGAPGAAVAMLVAGPLINLPSLLILGREAGTRGAVATAGGVWLAACAAGLLVL